MPNSPGHRPCTELETRAGIWRYDANRTGQRFSSAERFVTGLRNADGIAIDSTGLGVYATQHGRDQHGSVLYLTTSDAIYLIRLYTRGRIP
jgi:glucose/arabinose dehydrogenase